MSKLRNVRRRQHERFFRALLALELRGSPNVVPDSYNRALNRDIKRKYFAVPMESPTNQPSSVPVRVADDSTIQKENEHG